MWITMLGYAASTTVLATFCMSTMMPLRVIAIASNFLFSTYGALAHIYPVMILHLILLPINTVRLVQIRRLVQGLARAQTKELTIEALLPFMTRRNLKAGDILMRRNDRADRMFYLVNGEVQCELEELEKTLGPGNLVGEIGVFAQDHKRTATVRCITDCELYEITEAKAKQIYFQNPAFGYAVFQIVITRLLEDLKISRQHADLHRSDERPAANIKTTALIPFWGRGAGCFNSNPRSADGSIPEGDALRLGRAAL